jgi:lipoyl(octanoyl) transferase
MRRGSALVSHPEVYYNFLMTTCDALFLGQTDYQAAWDLQNRLAAEIATGQRVPSLLLLEHPHTYTIGRRGGDQHLLWDAERLESEGVCVHHVDRGGDITYHGPGQLVGYPLIPLATPGWQGERLPQADYVGYVRKLEKVIILTLARFGIIAAQREGKTGVWLPAEVWARCPRCDPGALPAPAKIASIGVKVDGRGITRHGFALNVDPDMRYWEGIVPCGLDGVTMAAMADFLDPVPGVEEVAQTAARCFGEVFGYEVILERL